MNTTTISAIRKAITHNKLGIAYIYWKGKKTNYMIDYLGNVYNYKTGNFIKAHKKSGKNGSYLKVKLYLDNGARGTATISREKMKAFRPCEDMHHLEVDHIDNNHLNDCITNYQWLTKRENTLKMHYYKQNAPF